MTGIIREGGIEGIIGVGGGKVGGGVGRGLKKIQLFSECL